MGDQGMSRCCMEDLPKDINVMKTTTQISFPPCMARSIMYEKEPLPVLPNIRVQPGYKLTTRYLPHDGLKTTYKEQFKLPVQKENFNFTRMPKVVRDYIRIRGVKPLSFGMSEYKRQFTFKVTGPSNNKGVSVERTSTCPMALTGRDERDPLPLTGNYGKYLDIYVSETRGSHRAFTAEEQKGIAAKDILTAHETMDIPKGRGFGCRFPVFPGQDLDSRDKLMFDKALFSSVPSLRFIPKGMPKVPNFGSESETQAAFARPSGVAMPRFTDFPGLIVCPSAGQTLCPPAMYTAESSIIHKHTSPQTVV